VINLITGIIGLAMVVTFLGFMVVWVKAIPLIIITLFVMGLAAVDLWQSVRQGENDAVR
jgi:hypothetical protein